MQCAMVHDAKIDVYAEIENCEEKILDFAVDSCPLCCLCKKQDNTRVLTQNFATLSVVY